MRYYHPIYMVKVLTTSELWCPALKHTYKTATLQQYLYSDFIISSKKEALEIFKHYIFTQDNDIKAIKLVELNYLNPSSESQVIEYREIRGQY